MNTDTHNTQDFQFQYVTGQARPTFPELLEGYKTAGDAVVQSEACAIDVRYGNAERETFDFFVGQGKPVATMIYYHAGYWQSRDKLWFRFFAPAYTKLGINVVFVNYPLCPTVTLTDLVDGVRNSVPAVLARAKELGQPELPLIAAGHSAGAHLAVEMALSVWPKLGERAQAVDGVLALSGIYDLIPLMSTTLNEKLKLDTTAAQANSPLHRVRSGLPPTLFIVGAAETPAFIAQNRAMADAWHKAGNDSAVDEVANADHFNLLQQFGAPASPTMAKVLELIGKAERRFAAPNKAPGQPAT